MKQEWQGEEGWERRDGGMDGAERRSNMEGDEWSCMPARRPAPGARFQGHEIGSGKCGGTGREVERESEGGELAGCMVGKRESKTSLF